MKSIFDHIETAKSKPHHVRKQIAFGAATGGTAFIALVWFTYSLATGSLAIKNATFDDSAHQPVVVSSDSGNQNLAGAAAAIQDASAPAHIEIVDVASSTRQPKQAEQTILPF